MPAHGASVGLFGCFTDVVTQMLGLSCKSLGLSQFLSLSHLSLQAVPEDLARRDGGPGSENGSFLTIFFSVPAALMVVVISGVIFFFFFCKTEQIILKNDQILPVRHWPPPEPGHQVRFCSSGTSAQPAVCPGDRARISTWTPNPGVKLGREWRPAFQSRRPVWPRPCRAELPLSRLEAWTRGDGRPARTKSGCRSGLWKRGSSPRELHSLERNEIETRTVHTS